MKLKKLTPIIVQAIVWIGLWSAFTLTGDPEDKLPAFYLVSTLRTLNQIVFFNLTYYFLLPLWFSGKRRRFYLLMPLAFAAFISISATIDFTIAKPEKMYVQARDRHESPRKERPLTWILLPPMFIGLAVFGVAASFRGFSEFERGKKAEEEAKRRQLEAEIALMKSQINPHFLLNTLNNLYALSLTEPAKTPDALLKLSEMVSYILHECTKPRVPVVSDIAFIENYITLQRLRLPSNVSLVTELPTSPPGDLGIEPMILIPFIENAFKHGLTTKQHCVITISISIQERKLILVVKNPVLSSRYHGDQTRMGIANTRQRLAHAYPGSHALNIVNDGEQHHVTLELTLHRER